MDRRGKGNLPEGGECVYDLCPKFANVKKDRKRVGEEMETDGHSLHGGQIRGGNKKKLQKKGNSTLTYAVCVPEKRERLPKEK